MKNKSFMKILSALLAVVMVLCSAPLSGFMGVSLFEMFSLKAEAYQKEGNFEYSVYEGKVTIARCINPVGDIVIPETLGGYPVTRIGYEAFHHSSLTSIVIPESITSIGGYAFYGCKNLFDVYYGGDIASWCSVSLGWDEPSYLLSYARNFYIHGELQKDVIIPDTVDRIAEGVFYDYSGLNSVVISDGVKIIGSCAFANCENLTTITIPESLESIGEIPFFGCSNLENVYYTGNLELWCKNGIAADIIPYTKNLYIDGMLISDELAIESMLQIWNSSFAYSGILSLYLNDIRMIGDSVFAYCEKLKEVVLENITIISVRMFYNCTSLNQVYIPKSVKIIQHDAFNNCPNIETVYYEGTEEEWNSIAVYPGNIDLFEANVVFLNNTGVKPNFASKGEFSVEDLTINYKGTVRLSENLEVNTSNDYKLTYRSSDESIVTVDENGYVTGVGRGSAEITVTLIDAYGNEVSDTAIVTVNITWWQWLIVIFLFGWIWY